MAGNGKMCKYLLCKEQLLTKILLEKAYQPELLKIGLFILNSVKIKGGILQES